MISVDHQGDRADVFVIGRLDDLDDALAAAEQVAALPAGTLVAVWVDSPGGNAAAGLAAHHVLAAHDGPVVAQVGRRANSAASLVVVAADYRRAHWTADVTVHYPAAIDGTDPDPDLPGPIAAIYARCCGGDPAWWADAMRAERVFLAPEMPALGLVHSIGGDWTGPQFDGRDPTDEETAQAVAGALLGMGDALRARRRPPHPR